MTFAAQAEDPRHAHVEAAWNQIDPARLTELVVGMVSIPSPTGEEAPLAEWLTRELIGAGLDASCQRIDDRQANAVGRLRGHGGGEDLLLFAPIDTLTVGDPLEDLPWIGRELRVDMRPTAVIEGDYVLGLGASNPKGHAAAIVAAAEAISRAGIPLGGDLIVGLGAGGMPTNGRLVRGLTRRNAGQGVGCSFMLEQGVCADHALIAKPGWSVAWEEVGICWFEIRVHGTFSYVGSRHRMAYRNPIVDASTVIAGLEEWFPSYTQRHTDGLVAPQGIVGSIESGWSRMAAVTPSMCRFVVDLRTNPRSNAIDVRREFETALEEIVAANPGLELECEMVLKIPGTHTPPEAAVIVAAEEAWEVIAGRPHVPIVGNSGATDANILRARGLPVARIGMDRIGSDAPVPLDFSAGMNVVDIRETVKLTRHIVHTAIALCTRERSRS